MTEKKMSPPWVRRLVVAAGPPVQFLGKGLLGLALTSLGVDASKRTWLVPFATLFEMVTVGVLLWTVAELVKDIGPKPPVRRLAGGKTKRRKR
ncbi:hypothetical protein [Thiomonas sp.]